MSDTGMHPELLRRFLGRIRVSEGCWTWTAGGTGGYGTIRFSGKCHYAHRLAYEQRNGPIPKALVIDHLCRTRRCVRPSHLRVTTKRENAMAPGSLWPARLNLLKTHCPHGHEYNAENTYKLLNHRYCRECHRKTARLWERRNRGRGSATTPKRGSD